MRNLFGGGFVVLLYCSCLNVYLAQSKIINIGNIVNEEVEREINLKGKYVRTNIEIKFPENAKPSTVYYHAVPQNLSDQIVDVLAMIDESDDLLNVQEVPKSNLPEKLKNHKIYEIEIPQGVQWEELKISELFKMRMNPFPRQISLTEMQYVILTDSKYLFSVYTTRNQISIYYLPSQNVEEYSPEGNLTNKNKEITYGPYTSISPLQSSEIFIHFQKNKPLIIFDKVEREIEVSHWGNIEVREYYHLKNLGASLKGEFSRIQLVEQNPDLSKNILFKLSTKLPRTATGLYYRDVIGNISSSSVEKATKQIHNVILEVQPRFPVLGGWNVSWEQGYNLRTVFYLKYNSIDDDHFILNQTFSHPFKDIITENYTLKVILPPGSSDIKAKLPFSVDKVSTGSFYSYLDLVGRPVITFEKKNVHSYHMKNFQISYNIDKIKKLEKVLMLIGFFLGMFLLLIFSSRFEFKINKQFIPVLEVFVKTDKKPERASTRKGDKPRKTKKR